MVNIDDITQRAKKLTLPQKRAAKLLAYGIKPSKVAKKLKITRDTLWKWRKLVKFNKLLSKFWNETDQYIESKQKNAMSLAWKTAEKLMKNPRWQACAKGAEMVFSMHRQGGTLLHKHDHTGHIDMAHGGEIKIDKKKLTTKKKNRIKELLTLTRDVMSPN